MTNSPSPAAPVTTILVTGPTGTVSSALIEALADRPGLRLRALMRDPAKGEHLRTRGVEVVRGDLDDARTLTSGFEGVDSLWLLTVPGPRAPENSMNAVWAARRAGVRRVVRLSAIGAAPDAPTRNGRLHALSDHEVIVSGLQWTILRPHFFMQNLLGWAKVIAQQGALALPFGDSRLGLVDARDIAQVAAQVLAAPAGHAGKTYTPTGPASLSGAEMATALSGALERPVRYMPLPPEAMRAGMIEAGASPWLGDMMLEYGQAYASGWGDFVTRDVPQIVGQPARSLATFARDHLAAFA
jgi:uncharacterized protein YbjT (DUF2867 family)